MKSPIPRNKQRPRRRRSKAGAPSVLKPRNPLLSYRIITLATLLRRSATLTYRRQLGLSQIDWSILALVGEHAPLSHNQLADLIGLDKGQLSRGVSALVAKGLITRENQSPRRGVQITLSGRGFEVYNELIYSALQRNREILAEIAESERKRFFVLLEKLTERAREILRREQKRSRV
jgi:DNA-binding MarR family transcriptional regulator